MSTLIPASPLSMRPNLPSRNKTLPAPQFAACVNSSTSANAFMDKLISGTWSERWHAIASAGNAMSKKAEAPDAIERLRKLAEVLTRALNGTQPLDALMNDEKTRQLTLLALLEAYKSGKMDDHMKHQIRFALRAAETDKRFARDRKSKALLEWVKKQMDKHDHGDTKEETPPASVQEAMQAYQAAHGS